MSLPSSEPPVAPSHAVIEHLSVQGAVHFHAIDLPFHADLNFLIGGRGTGKSGVLHILRYTLGATFPASYAADVDEYLRETFAGGTATVRVRTRHGVRYTASRASGGDPVVRDEQGREVSPSVLAELFAFEAYGQNEIEGIARNAGAQLALIDRFIEPDVRRIDAEVAGLERRITEVAEQRRRLAREIADLAAREAELPAVVEALKGVDLGDPTATEATRRERERAHDAKVLRGREHAAMGALGSELDGVRTALDAFSRDAVQKLSRAVEADLERGAHGDAFRRAHAAMQRLAGAIEGAFGRLRTEAGVAERAVADERTLLATAHAREEEEYRSLVVRDDADRARAAESERLHKRFAELSAIAKRLADRRREEGAARDAEAALLAEHERLFDEKSALRKRVCQEWTRALEGEVRADLKPRADPTRWVELLADILKGANVRPSELVETIALRIRPQDLVAMVESDEIGPIMALDPSQRGHAKRAEKILEHIRESGRLHEIATMRLEDVPVIDVKTRKSWRAVRRASAGQRCAAILSILLLRSDLPLLVDQAEDNIDNPYVYQVLCVRFAQVKVRRQLIVATLNPNPPALADADRIFALDVDDEGHGVLAGAGKFEEVREHVEWLEGGREAFRKRAERYGLVKREEA